MLFSRYIELHDYGKYRPQTLIFIHTIIHSDGKVSRIMWKI